jgi:hypothetical protein
MRYFSLFYVVDGSISMYKLGSDSVDSCISLVPICYEFCFLVGWGLAGW